MSISAGILKRISGLSLSAEAFQEVLAIIADLQGADESRRGKQRARTKSSRDRKKNGASPNRDGNCDSDVTVTLQSRDGNGYTPPEHIDNTLTKDSIKKVSKKVYLCADIPDLPPEAASAFAESEGGWLLERTLREWQRFRDYQISKNKKHNSLVALLASWRNWVRSPFQATGKTDDRSVLKAADRQMDRFGGREAAANYVPGSAGPRPLSLDHSHEPPSPKLISSR